MGLNAFRFKQPLANEQQSYTYQAIFEPEGVQLEGDVVLKGLPGDRVQNNRASTHVIALGQRRILFIEPKIGDHQLLVDHLARVGESRFKIHSITPDGGIYVSPCVYLHDYKSEFDLLKRDLADIIRSPQFRVFRQRNRNPGRIDVCADCHLLQQCGGGCAGRSYLHHLHTTGVKTMLSRDPYCPREIGPRQPFPQRPELLAEQRLVHMDYLCTWIGKPL